VTITASRSAFVQGHGAAVSELLWPALRERLGRSEGANRHALEAEFDADAFELRCTAHLAMAAFNEALAESASEA